MDLYSVNMFDLTTTPVKVVDAAPIDRRVYLIERENETWIGFAEFEADSTAKIGVGGVTNDLILPAGEELWARAYASSVTSKLEAMVTSIGR